MIYCQQIPHTHREYGSMILSKNTVAIVVAFIGVGGAIAVALINQRGNDRDKVEHYFSTDEVNKNFISKTRLQNEYMSLDSVQANFLPKSYVWNNYLPKNNSQSKRARPPIYLISPRKFTYEFPDYVQFMGYSSAISLSPLPDEIPPFILEVNLLIQQKSIPGNVFSFTLCTVINGREYELSDVSGMPPCTYRFATMITEIPPSGRFVVRFHFTRRPVYTIPIDYNILPGSTIALK